MRQHATPFDVTIRIITLVALILVYADIDDLLPGAQPILWLAVGWLAATVGARTANREPQPCDCPCRSAPPSDDNPFGYHP